MSLKSSKAMSLAFGFAIIPNLVTIMVLLFGVFGGSTTQRPSAFMLLSTPRQLEM
jgi:hypothetical protein